MPLNLNEIRFEEFRLSISERCLFRGDQLVPLTGKEYEILAALLEARGQVVQKSDLLQRLWPETVVDESNLFHHIRSLRKKLGQPYIETVPGRGYRFIVDAEPEPVQPLLPRRKTFGRWVVGLAGLVILAGAVSLRPHPKAAAVAVSVLTNPEIGQGPQVLKFIEVGAPPSGAYLNAERSEVYVSEPANDAVSVIDIKSDKVVSRIAVGHQPSNLAPSPDGKKLFIAEEGGGVGVIDMATHGFQSAADLKDAVNDVAVTPDGKAAYLALGFLGLAKLDLPTRSVRIISKTGYVHGLVLTADGRRLYVAYEAGGPGGSFGHDAIGYFDTATDQLAGAITGFANVGTALRLSPDGSQVWENGADACDSPQYDHVGCPAVPAGLLNIISAADNKLRAVAVRGGRVQGITFSPDAEYVAVGLTDALLVLRTKDLTIAASLPVGSTGRLAFTADGLRVYSPVNGRAAVAVIQVGVEVQALRLTGRKEGDQALTIGIPTGPDYHAESIDPGSLRLDGVPVNRTETGALAASVEGLVGFPGHSLIVHFTMDGAKSGSKMTLVGKTYSGMPIRGMVDAL